MLQNHFSGELPHIKRWPLSHSGSAPNVPIYESVSIPALTFYHLNQVYPCYSSGVLTVALLCAKADVCNIKKNGFLST